MWVVVPRSVEATGTETEQLAAYQAVLDDLRARIESELLASYPA